MWNFSEWERDVFYDGLWRMGTERCGVAGTGGYVYLSEWLKVYVGLFASLKRCAIDLLVLLAGVHSCVYEI